ncbi:MAG: hypothetical protein KJ726_04205 [Verrucomicrobia bacterium]|nr:hypothetical protein [Verrucomicrobiota bacterium]
MKVWEKAVMFAGLILITACGAASTPEIASRLGPGHFKARELQRLDQHRRRMEEQRRRLEAALPASPETKARRRRLEEDLAELDRMRQRLKADIPARPAVAPYP